MPYRQEIWQRLATDLKPRHLEQIAQVISLDDLLGAVADILQGKVIGQRTRYARGALATTSFATILWECSAG
jgi:hypothetical protein